MLEHDIALGVLQVLVQAHTGPALAKDARQRRLADLNRFSAQVRPIQFQQVKGVQERLGLIPPMAEQLKGSQALLITTHHLAVDQAGNLPPPGQTPTQIPLGLFVSPA